MSILHGNQIQDNSVDLGGASGKLSGTLSTSKLGVLGTSVFADDSVSSAKIKDGEVTQTGLATSAVYAGDIAASNITTAKIVDNAAASKRINNANVTTAKIVAANVTTAKLKDTNVTSAKIAANAVNSAAMLAGSITPAKVNTTSFGTLDLASGGGSLTVDQGYGALADSSAISKSVLDKFTPFATRPSVVAKTEAALPSNSVSATTIEASSNGALPAVDGITLAANDRLFVSNESGVAAANQGLYVVTNVGSGSAKWLLTRAADFTTGADVTGVHFFVERGTVSGNQGFVVSSDTSVVGTNNLTFSSFNTSQYSSGNGTLLNGTTLSVYQFSGARLRVDSGKLRRSSLRIATAKTTSEATTSNPDTGVTQFTYEDTGVQTFAGLSTYPGVFGGISVCINGAKLGINSIKNSSSGTEPLYFWDTSGGGSVITKPSNIPASGVELRWDAGNAGYDLPSGSTLRLTLERF